MKCISVGCLKCRMTIPVAAQIGLTEFDGRIPVRVEMCCCECGKPLYGMSVEEYLEG
jgi:hypothetical protein